MTQRTDRELERRCAEHWKAGKSPDWLKSYRRGWHQVAQRRNRGGR